MSHTPPVTEEQALARLQGKGYEPAEPYSGFASGSWQVRCLTCGAIRNVRISAFKPCAHTPHNFPTADRPASAPIPNDRAEKELRDAGFEPMVPYPGLVSMAWQARCTTCGRVRQPTLSHVRRGNRCKHSNTGRRDGQ